jgi:hypothetical protein
MSILAMKKRNNYFDISFSDLSIRFIAYSFFKILLILYILQAIFASTVYALSLWHFITKDTVLDYYNTVKIAHNEIKEVF